MRADLSLLVSIHTWRAPFEFAHFTNTQLASAVLAVAKGPIRCSLTELKKSFAAQRKSPTPNVQGAWQRKIQGVSKVDLAIELWPTLQKQVVEALEGKGGAPPILGKLRKALAAAQRIQGLNGLVYKK